MCPPEPEVQLIDTALKKCAPHTFKKGCHLTDWNNSVYLFALWDEKAVVRRNHQHWWSAITYLMEQFFQ